MTQTTFLWARVTRRWLEVWWVLLFLRLNDILGKLYILVPVPMSVPLFQVNCTHT